MVKHDDQHLTTEQLSALIDKQLAAQELAACDAHLQTCQQCQNALAGLQQTVALLQALPQPALPKSFTLPSAVTYLQERPQRQAVQQPVANPRTRERSWTSYAQRSLRAVCTIAAVIGLVFLVSGLLPTLPRGGTSSSSTAGTSAQSVKNGTTFGPAKTNAANPATPPSPVTADHNSTPGFKPQAVGTPVARVPTTGTGANHSPPHQSQPSIPILDLSTPLVRQVLGFSLFVLGIVGVLLTRRKQRDRRIT